MHAESRILRRLSDGDQTPADPAQDIRERSVTTPGRNEIGRIGALLGDAGHSSHGCAGSSVDRDTRGRIHAFELG